MNTLDMTEILLAAYRLADQINNSQEVQHYLECKKRMEEDPEAQKMIREFQKLKDRYEEAQRFGIFHPNYHEAKEAALSYQKKLRQYPVVRDCFEAEERLDQLLHAVSLTIARSVSPSIKVPGNDPEPGVKKLRRACGR
ncbi:MULTISPECIES: YlbF family regulator [Thermoactinomyces]|nr:MULTISPECIES: YlbF family regulator [Thermoactinomyces]